MLEVNVRLMLGCGVGEGQRQKKAQRERREKKLVSPRGERYQAVCAAVRWQTRKQFLVQMPRCPGVQLSLTLGVPARVLKGLECVSTAPKCVDHREEATWVLR